MSAAVECRAGCGEPVDASLLDADGAGLHPTCVAPAVPVLPVLHDVLARHQQAMQRNRQRAVGASQIGEPCDRALAYRLAEVGPVRDEPLKWAPLLGTWTHAGIAEALAAENKRLGRERYWIERGVVISERLGVRGTVDVYDVDTDEVIDWKLSSAKSIGFKRKHGPGATYRVQAHAYALGWRNAGMAPRSVRIVFLPKSSISISDGYEWSEPFDPEIGQGALRRLLKLRRLIDVLGVRREPQQWALIAATPESATGCDWCPWRRDAWLTPTPADDTGCPGV